MINLYRAAMSDAARLYSWRVDTESMDNSLHNEPFSFSDHLVWLKGKLSDAACRIYIARDQQRSVTAGVVRLDKLPDGVHISIAVDAHQRGRGYAHEILQSAIAQAGVDFENPLCLATVKESNRASLRAFWAAGFALVKQDGVLLYLERPWNLLS